MTHDSIDCLITSRERLREIVNAPDPNGIVMRKQLPTLDEHCRAFIAKCPFLILSTANADGQCDASPRGDAAGFVQVLNDQILIIPDRPGNRRLDAMLNIVENPHAGLLFVIPGVEETLRVNGRAVITEDPNLLSRMAFKSKTPQLGIVVQVEEAYFHCARAFKRSRLWEPDGWIDRAELPSLGKIIADQVKSNTVTSEELDRDLDESNKRLY